MEIRRKFVANVIKFTHGLVKVFIAKNVIDVYTGKKRIIFTVTNVNFVQKIIA